MTYRSFLKPFLFVGVALVLAACQSGEERAEEHYQNALRLIEEGDPDRAIIEFLNVFQNNGQHRDAREALAELHRELGQETEAYSQYLRLAEQYPTDIPTRIALAELAIANQIWDEARRHGREAINGAPEDPRVVIIAVNLDYSQAVEDEDDPARRDALDEAQRLLAEEPSNILLQRIVIDSALRDGDLEAALASTRAAIAIDPESRQLYDTELQLLIELERFDELEELILSMIEQFPGDEVLTTTLLRFYISQQDIDAAANFLSRLSEQAESEADRTDALAALVQLRIQTEGVDAGRAALDEILVNETEPNATLEVMQAGMRFDVGEVDEAIADVEAVIARLPEEEQGGEEAGRFRVILARMLLADGNQVGARALIDEVLANDSGQVDALKIKSSWLIEEDETREAISLLRRALDSDADDVEALTLSAQAHARNGDRDLAREFLALAASASGNAPGETLRYVDWLMSDERYFPAEEALIDALRVEPGNVALLSRLGEVYILMEDWSRAEQVERTLERQDSAEARGGAVQLRVSRLAGQDRLDAALQILEDIAAENGNSASAQLSVIQGRLAAGDAEGALSFVEGLIEQESDQILWRFALATAQAATGLYEEAIANYRLVLDEAPTNERVWLDLIRAISATGDVEGARAALSEGRETIPDGVNLLWSEASFLENTGDIEAAIGIYEQLYERLPNVPVMANNLASLLTTFYDDDETLARAYTIARRLRGIDFPPFQDTYGWIAARRGDYTEALEHLEPAAEGLPTNPLVQFHLGMTYLAVERFDEAKAQLERALELAGPEDTRPQFDIARSSIAEIDAALAAAEAEGASDQ